MAASKNFIGLSQFVHFYGVVEDRMDPLKTGRVRVRCLGFHTKDKVLLPTADLPWAQVLLPITSSGISGVGTTPLGLVEGSWVVGYFRDGEDAQEPIVLGSLPGKPKVGASPNADDGFFDPSGSYPRYIGEPDCNRLAVNAQKSTDEDGDTWVEKMIVSATGTGELIKVYQRVVCALFPEPDLSFFIDTDPKISFERKGEYDIPTLKERRKIYDLIFQHRPVDYIINNNDSNAKSELLQIIKSMGK